MRVYSYDVFHKNTSWDHQWTLALWTQHGLSIVTETNLVSNIGFRENNTNT